MKKYRLQTLILIVLSACLCWPAQTAQAVDSAYSGNFIVPESQSGFYEEAYEGKVFTKLERGVKNFGLSWLEIPHSIKGEYYYRKQQYLPAGFETFFIGLFKGAVNTVGRAGVGLYEFFTSPYPQDPILPEMEEWLY